MKLTVFILLTFCLHLSAKTDAQNVTLSLRNASLETVFKAIKKQTGYSFLAKAELLDHSRMVTIDIQNMPLQSALNLCFVNQPFGYSIEGKIIILHTLITGQNTLSLLHFAWPVRGKVVDSAGRAVEGASVRLTPDNRGTVTNSYGIFTFNNVEAGKHKLLISCVGYENYELDVTISEIEKLPLINIKLIAATKTMTQVEVVNTGYQSISRERSTGSFGTIDKEQLERPTSNLATRLIGTTAGLQAKLDVNGNPTFRLRGQTTMIREDEVQPLAQQPLVVLDGFPIQGDFNTINPNDIESVTILKDAAATSIWGARAANGVIVVVSKSARKGMPLKINLSSFRSMSKKFDLDYVNPLASSSETVDYEIQSFNKWFAQMPNGTVNTDYRIVSSLGTTALTEHLQGRITLAERDAILNQLRAQSNKEQITNHLLANPSTQQINLSLSASTAKMNNVFSLFYEDRQSHFKKTGNEKYMLNFRTTANIFKWLDLSLGGMVQYNKVDSSGVTLKEIQGISPYEMLLNADGSFTDIHQFYYPTINRVVPKHLFPYSDWRYNPVQEIQNRSLTSEQINTRLQAGLGFRLMSGLRFESKVQWELFNTFNRSLNNENTFAVRNLINTSSTWNRATNIITPNLPSGSILAQNRRRGQAINFRNQLSFNRRFGSDHELNAIAGTETNSRTIEGYQYPVTYGYNDQNLTTGVFPNGPGGNFYRLTNWLGQRITFNYGNTFVHRTERFFSYYGNVAYTYKDKYTVSGSYRTDAANLIAADPKYRYDPFWSAGASWQLHKEKFFDDVRSIDRLVLRATYGYNGNVDRTTAFQPLINLLPIPNVFINAQQANISSYGNPDLRWEKTGSWNLGVDFIVLNKKLFGKIDVYNKTGRDLIALLSIPAVNGTSSQKLNNAAMTNRGIELEIGTVLPISGKNISWQSNLSFAYNKNKVTKLFIANYRFFNLTGTNSESFVEGYDANAVWRFEYAGLQNDFPVVRGPKGTLHNLGTTIAGDAREYMKMMGTAVAPYTLGFMNSFKVYDFTISFIMTGKFGHVFQRKGFNYPPNLFARALPNSRYKEVVNGDPSKVVPLPSTAVSPTYYQYDIYARHLDYLIENASHFRLQEANITYRIKTSWLSKIHFTDGQLFAQGNDLFTIYANKAKEDPEYPLGTMKPLPTLTIGFKCEF